MLDPMNHEHWGLVYGLTLPVMLLSIAGLSVLPMLRRWPAQVIALAPLAFAACLWGVTFYYWPGAAPRVARPGPGCTENFDFPDIERGYGGVYVESVRAAQFGYRNDDTVLEITELPSRAVHRVPADRLRSSLRVDLDMDATGTTRPEHLRPQSLEIAAHGPASSGNETARIEFTVVGGARYWNDCREVRGYFQHWWSMFWIATFVIMALIGVVALRNRNRTPRGSSRPGPRRMMPGDSCDKMFRS